METNDNELINEYLNGNTEAFTEIFNRYKLPLYNYIYSMVKNRETAEDIFQEAFIKLINNLNNYRTINLKSYIFTIARNKIIDYFKSKKTKDEKETLSLDSTLYEYHEENNTLSDRIKDEYNTEYEIIKNEEIKKLYEAINMLNREYQEIIFLKHFSNLSFAEISEITKTPIGTLLSRFKRALDILRKNLENT